jgi:menaquinone-9 beta-reductase
VFIPTPQSQLRVLERLALFEKHRHIDTHKVLCTHFIHAAAMPTIRRLGLDRRIEAVGGLRNELVGWTRWGWAVPPAGEPSGYNIRREKLDPLLREMAANTPGVDLMTGRKVVGLLDEDGRVSGVHLRRADGREDRVRARLVVGADGARSTVADLSGANERIKANERCFFFAYFRGVQLSSGSRSQFWVCEPDVAYAFPNDEGLSLLAYFPSKQALPEFQRDREATLVARLRTLVDAPALGSAERVSPVITSTDHPIIHRSPVPAPGVALVGDAALTSDPTWGVGCEWAFRGAEWLVDDVGPALAGGRPLAPALRRYRRRRRTLRGHQFFIEQFSSAGPLTPLDRLLLSGASRDPRLAAHVASFLNGRLPLRRFVGPAALARAARVNVRHRFTTGQCPVKQYNRKLMNLILSGKARIAEAVNATVISLDQAPQGYAEFDRGEAKKYVIDPHGSVAA